MPTYDYQCETCNHQFDRFEKISSRDEPCKEPCPECNENKVRRGWFNAPVGGVDATLTANKATGGQWNQLMEKMKKSPVMGRDAKANLDRTSNERNTGARYGCQ